MSACSECARGYPCELHPNARPISDGGGRRRESVAREVENITLGKLRLSRLTGTDCKLTAAEAAAVLDMLRSG